jgi:small conductance mechanosensitive channel
MDINASFQNLAEKVENWLNTLIISLPNIVSAILVMLLFIVISKLCRKIAHKILTKISATEAVTRLLTNIIAVAIIVAGLFVSLGILDLDKTVTSLLAGVGIIGLALGFAFQDIASNFIAGVLIAIRKPFGIGDLIESNDYFGKVASMNLRTTNIRTMQGQIVLIPNSEVFQNPIINYSSTGERRIDLGVGVSYGDDLEKVKSVTLAAVNRINNINKDKGVTLYFDEFGDSSINFNVRFWVDFHQENKPYLEAKSDAIMKIKKAFDENDITIPFPIRTLDFGIKGGEKLNEVLDTGALGNGSK